MQFRSSAPGTINTFIMSNSNKTQVNKYAYSILLFLQLEADCRSQAESIWETIVRQTLTITTVILGLLLATATNALKKQALCH